MSEIIININEANKAQKYQNENELFQIDAFKRVAEILKEHKVGNDTSDITDCRFHDTIFIDGDRGVGKTAFMINIENYYKNIAKIETPKYIFLKPVDPTLLEHTEKFLSVILARIVEMVSKKLKNSCIDEENYCIDDDCNKVYNRGSKQVNCTESYYKVLEKLSKSLEAIKTLEKDVGIEEIASNKSSLKLEQHAHEFFQVVCKMFGVNAIVMLIDDVDMAFDKGFDVLEVVRKYLASPYLIPIVAGDMKLYREIVETKFIEKIKFYDDVKYLKDSIPQFIDSKEYKDKLYLLDNLVEQYLHKVFPSEYHIKLKDIFTILKERKVQVMLNNNLLVAFSEIENFEIQHINLGINQNEFRFSIFSDNTRELIQYLYNKKNIYNDFFVYLSKSKEKKEQTNEELIHKFINSISYRDSLYKTSEFYKFSTDRKKKELSILLENDSNSFLNNEYNLYKAFSNDKFRKLDKFNGIEKSKDKFSIKAEGLQTIMNNTNNNYHDIANYIIDLFIFNDYYSSYQRRNYIYAGKFLESIIYSYSLSKKIEISNDMKKEINEYISLNVQDKDKWSYQTLKNLNDQVYSILYDEKDVHVPTEKEELFKKFKSMQVVDLEDTIHDLRKIAKEVIPFGSEFLHNHRYKEENFDDDSNDENESKNKYDLKNLSRAIVIWRNVFIGNNKLNSLSMYEIIYKFFRNIEKAKFDDKISKFKEFKDNNVLTYLQRIVLMFINSVAFFENDSKDVANINMALGEKLVLDTVLEKTPASLQNIKPMFDKEGSLTRALFFHPIISHVLFPEENLKLKDLKFVNTTKIQKKEVNNKQKDNSKNNLLDEKFGKYFKSTKLFKEDLNMNHIDIYKSYFREFNQDIDNDSKKILRNGNMKFARLYKYIEENVSDKDSDLEELMRKYQELISK